MLALLQKQIRSRHLDELESRQIGSMWRACCRRCAAPGTMVVLTMAVRPMRAKKVSGPLCTRSLAKL